ncbi:MAG: hypothetical protein IIX91_03845, partial [Clostridia bacterium]|nr:hypothetical protein [Clostridia bacterium]
GLDCMRFVGKALELTDEDGLAPWEFIKYYLQEGLGHRVYSVSELDEMDIIISSKHAMFYWKTENGLV